LPARGAGAVHGSADPAGGDADGNRTHRAWRRRPGAGLTLRACAAQSDRGWICLGSLAACVAGHRPARRFNGSGRWRHCHPTKCGDRSRGFYDLAAASPPREPRSSGPRPRRQLADSRPTVPNPLRRQRRPPPMPTPAPAPAPTQRRHHHQPKPPVISAPLFRRAPGHRQKRHGQHSSGDPDSAGAG
jgi:hypothetical protein